MKKKFKSTIRLPNKRFNGTHDSEDIGFAALVADKYNTSYVTGISAPIKRNSVRLFRTIDYKPTRLETMNTILYYIFAEKLGMKSLFDKKFGVENIISFLGWIMIIAGFVAGIMNIGLADVPDAAKGYIILQSVLYIFIGLTSGTTMLGLSKIIRLLIDLRNK